MIVSSSPYPNVPMHPESTFIIFLDNVSTILFLVLFFFSPLTHWARWHLCLIPSPTTMCKEFSNRRDQYIEQKQHKAVPAKEKKRGKCEKIDTDACSLELDTLYL